MGGDGKTSNKQRQGPVNSTLPKRKPISLWRRAKPFGLAYADYDGHNDDNMLIMTQDNASKCEIMLSVLIVLF